MRSGEDCPPGGRKAGALGESSLRDALAKLPLKARAPPAVAGRRTESETQKGPAWRSRAGPFPSGLAVVDPAAIATTPGVPKHVYNIRAGRGLGKGFASRAAGNTEIPAIGM
jgi:hypothetical protein